MPALRCVLRLRCVEQVPISDSSLWPRKETLQREANDEEGEREKKEKINSGSCLRWSRVALQATLKMGGAAERIISLDANSYVSPFVKVGHRSALPCRIVLARGTEETTI